MSASNRRRLLPAAFALALAIGCSGEVDPLAEAIEVRDLGLVTLDIVEPVNTIRPLFINPDQEVRFTLRGTNASGTEIEVAGENRAWSVTEPSVARIDANGELVGLADGTTAVDVRIGDVVAQPFDVVVSRSSVATIERIVGPDTIDPCVVEGYTAIGGFADGSERFVPEAAWTASAAAGAELLADEDGGVTLSTDRPGTLELTATVNQASLALPITVESSLTALEVGPDGSLTVSEGGDLPLSAVGRYESGDGNERAETVTESVDWQIVSGAELATIGNEAGARGLLETTDAGTVQVQASCGDVDSDVRDVLVSDSSSSDGSTTGGLAFEGASGAGDDGDGGDLTVRASDGQVQLRVSSGSDRYDSEDDVTDDALWEIIDGNEEFAIADIDRDGLDRGRLTLFGPTGRIQVRATYRGLSSVLTVTIN